MSFTSMRTTHVRHGALHNPLHHPSKRRMTLFEHNVEVVRHHDVCEKCVLERRHCLLDVARDARADIGRENWRAILCARRDVKPRIWQVQTTYSGHTPRCTCDWGGAMGNGAAGHKYNVGPFRHLSSIVASPEPH
jgi:hypothetical protein